MSSDLVSIETMPLTRFSKNPILKPSNIWWERNAVYNPGVAVYQNKITLLYRAQGPEWVSRFGLAQSKDGFNFKKVSEFPVMEPEINEPFERLGVEDPRIIKMGESFLITYTAASLYPARMARKGAESLFKEGVPWRIRIGLAETKDFNTFEKLGFLLDDLDAKDSVLFPEKIENQYVLITRSNPNMVISYSPNLVTWTQPEFMAGPRFGMWDGLKIGAGSPPIKTRDGWLLFYHGVNDKKIYHLGALLLDLNNPKIILYRSKKPLLIPEKPYEKKGLTPNIVFTCGAIEWDDQYFIYYGGADRVICVATCHKDLNGIF